ncbi:MAG TPA: hypothetical protein V6D07_18665 [Trichocoleus sp.]
MARETYDPNKVRPAMCSKCPWRPENQSRFGSRLLAKLTEMVLNYSNHFCHLEQDHGERSTWNCRGSRDLQLKIAFNMGVIPEPTDEAWRQTLEKIQQTSIGIGRQVELLKTHKRHNPLLKKHVGEVGTVTAGPYGAKRDKWLVDFVDEQFWVREQYLALQGAKNETTHEGFTSQS